MEAREFGIEAQVPKIQFTEVNAEVVSQIKKE
jgi:hypothetical protein